MKLELEAWHLITLLIAFISFSGAMGKVLLDQSEKRQVERAAAQDKAREAGQMALRETLAAHQADERSHVVAIQELERDFLKWRAELPVNYVRREDYVRGQSVIEAKLDALYSRLELAQIKGIQHVGPG